MKPVIAIKNELMGLIRSYGFIKLIVVTGLQIYSHSLLCGIMLL